MKKKVDEWKLVKFIFFNKCIILYIFIYFPSDAETPLTFQLLHLTAGILTLLHF